MEAGIITEERESKERDRERDILIIFHGRQGYIVQQYYTTHATKLQIMRSEVLFIAGEHSLKTTTYIVPTCAAMATNLQYLHGIDMWTSERATYASRDTSCASRRTNNVGCFKTCIILYCVIKHLIFDSKIFTLPKQLCRYVTVSTDSITRGVSLNAHIICSKT